MRPRLLLHPGKDKPVRQRHPWVFEGAVLRVEGRPASGDLVDIVSADGQWLAAGEYSPKSQIRARAFSWDSGARIDEGFWRERLASAIARRRQLLPDAEACRLVFAESDGLPGLIVDRYGPHLVLQALTAGAEARKDQTVAHLAELLSPVCILERDDPVRQKEGLASAEGPLWGMPPAAPVTVREHGLVFQVDLHAGHKTGFYLDQAANRAVVAAHCAGAGVLNAFSYTGGFAVHALAAGALHVTNVDSSADALRLAALNCRLNGFASDRFAQVEADVFVQLRRWRDEGRRFDAIILDPPKFALSRSQIDRAARGYKDINWLALRLLRPGGILATFSCSGLVDRDLFQKIIFGAALDANRDVRILSQLSQGSDHPVLLSFPEGAYLKGLLCLVE